MVEWLFLAVQCGCLQFVIVVFPDHTHLLLVLTTIGIKHDFHAAFALISARPKGGVAT